jgi:NAD kinase
MDINRILIVSRTIIDDFYTQKYGVDSLDDLIGLEKGFTEEVIKNKKARSRAQREFINELVSKYGLASEQFVGIEDITKNSAIFDNYDIVVAFGGDGNFADVAHLLDDIDKPLIGLRADWGSVGGLLYYDRENFGQALKSIEKDDFNLKEWARLQAFINGKPVKKAIGQYSIAATFSYSYMSKFDLEVNGVEYSPQLECSGVLVCTGAGSTGQFRSSTWYLGSRVKSFKPDERKAMYAAVNPFSPFKSPFEKYDIQALCGEIRQGEELVLISRCKIQDEFLTSHGLTPGDLTPDAKEHYFFKEGDEIKIKLADTPLKIVNVPGMIGKKWS